MDTATATMTPGHVTSRDGTRIGYLRVGEGPAVVVVHGANESARSHTALAAALADDFTVYLVDRRGRGLSGPFGPDHDLRTEVDDVAAVLDESGAERVFGVSMGGLVALEAARSLPVVRRTSVYEPALLSQTGRYTDWLPRFDREIADGDVAAALVTSMYGLDLAPAALRLMPRRLLVALTERLMAAEDRQASADAVTMRRLAPTLHHDAALLAETAGTVARYAEVSSDVLLLRGTRRGPAFLAPALDALERTLPSSTTVVLPGLDHGGSSDPGPANRHGRPDVVAEALRPFFSAMSTR